VKRLFAKLGITDKDSFCRFAVQFLKFGVVGLSNTLISLAIYYIFIYINKDWYVLGNVVGWVVSVANSFFLNRKFVFKDSKESILKTLLKTYLSYGGSFLLSTLFLFVQVEWLGVSEIIAPIINLIVTIPLNFLINKFWTFK
jgi:putative flippase GtrA